jgi:hypothetical protein
MFRSSIFKPPPKGPILPYLTPHQLRQFKEEMQRGEVTIYRRKQCPVDKTWMPSSMEFCSKECFEQGTKKARPRKKGKEK